MKEWNWWGFVGIGISVGFFASLPFHLTVLEFLDEKLYFNVIAVFVGALVTYLAARWYFEKASKELQAVGDELSVKTKDLSMAIDLIMRFLENQRKRFIFDKETGKAHAIEYIHDDPELRPIFSDGEAEILFIQLSS